MKLGETDRDEILEIGDIRFQGFLFCRKKFINSNKIVDQGHTPSANFILIITWRFDCLYFEDV